MRTSRPLPVLFAVLLGASLFAGAACGDERAPKGGAAPSAAPGAAALGGAAPGAAAPGEQAALLERANLYWKARVARDPSVTTYYPPVEKRIAGGQIPENGAVRFDAFHIESVEIQGDTGTVTVRVDTHIDGRTPFPIPQQLNRRTLRERWDRIDGVWYKQTVVPALRAASADLQRAFERRRAEQAAAEAATKDKTAGPGALSEGAGADPGVDSGSVTNGGSAR